MSTNMSMNQMIEDLREDFVAYIRDTEYPIGERWEVFRKAPRLFE